MPQTRSSDLKRSFFFFVASFGIINLFADLTYEGGRSASGPFLAVLGASAATVGFVAGLGELFGFALRWIFGLLADKTGKYWAFVFAGYTINMLAVPALALAGNWPLAAGLLIAERTGKAIRKPSVEALLADAGNEIGHGWVFGLNEFLDQTGATLGPLLVAFVVYRRGNYHNAFAALLIPALLCIACLFIPRLIQPKQAPTPKRLSNVPQGAFWLYAAAGACFAAGFADFALISYHFLKTNTLNQAAIPAVYSISMGVSAVAAVILGRLLDRYGAASSIAAFAIAVVATPLVFLGHGAALIAGMIAWGIGLAAQDAVLKAMVARVVQIKRSTAFGIFDGIYGISWFLGSAALGLIYSHSLFTLILVSAALQTVALPLFWAGIRASERAN